MKRAIDKYFQVTNHNMNQWQPSRSLFRRCHLLLVYMFLGDGIQCWKRIGTNHLTRFQMTLAKFTHTVLADGLNRFSSHETGMFHTAFNRNQDRFFPRCSAPSFPSFLAANIGVITFNQSFKPINAVPMRHDCPNLVENPVSGPPSDFDMLTQPQCGNAAFVRGTEINRPEPFDQRQIGRMEDCPGCHTRLMMTMATLIDLSRCYIAVFFPRTFGTAESSRPSHLFQSLCACFFGSKSILPLEKRVLLPFS